jgi:hypothetical protein
MATVGNQLLENNVPYVKDNKGTVTKYDFVQKGAANFDASGSTGTFKFPTGAVSGQAANVIDATADASLTAAESGSIVLLDKAAGVTLTLPAASAGLVFTFIVVTTVTSNAYKVITKTTASEFIQGYLGVPVAAGTQKLFFADGSSDVSVNLNGTTTGGLLGGRFTAECLTTGLWQVSGQVEGSGTVATPFATS